MSKIEEVRAQMVAAMKNKDKERKETLSMLLAALKNKAIDKRADLTEAEENEVIKKEIKQTQETMDLAPADREDIKEECAKRLAVLKEFAPEEMSEEQIRAEINEVLKNLGITEPTTELFFLLLFFMIELSFPVLSKRAVCRALSFLFSF